MPTLYGFLPSPPCRAVLMTAKAVGLDLDLVVTNILEGEHRKPEFLEMNPRHTIPTLDDDGYILTESRAIMCYIMDKYGAEDDQMFPKDPQQRNRILERLMFDQGCLYQCLTSYYTFASLFGGEELDESKLAPVQEAFEYLDKYLEASDWVAGENMTIADISVFITVTQAELFGMDLEPYTNVTRWFETCKSDLPGQDINEEGISMFKKFLGKD